MNFPRMIPFLALSLIVAWHMAKASPSSKNPKARRHSSTDAKKQISSLRKMLSQVERRVRQQRIDLSRLIASSQQIRQRAHSWKPTKQPQIAYNLLSSTQHYSMGWGEPHEQKKPHRIVLTKAGAYLVHYSTAFCTQGTTDETGIRFEIPKVYQGQKFRVGRESNMRGEQCGTITASSVVTTTAPNQTLYVNGCSNASSTSSLGELSLYGGVFLAVKLGSSAR